MGERYPPGINCLRIENISYLYENRCLITFEGGETPMAYCSILTESLRFDQCFRPFFRHFATMKVISYKVEFTNTSSAGRTARKITKILRSVGF